VKRPISIYFIAVWCFFGLAIQDNSLSRLLAAKFSDESSSVDTEQTICGIVGILIIWHVVYLIQLKAFNRWFSIVLFGWWTLELTWILFALFHTFVNPVREVLFFLALDALNVACIWYLGRRSFRAFAVKFVAEREEEKFSRAIQKKIKRGL